MAPARCPARTPGFRGDADCGILRAGPAIVAPPGARPPRRSTPMSIDDAIRQFGFRRWYERRLIESHAYLVTALLALIAMLVVVETIDLRGSLIAELWLLGIAAAGGLVCVLALRQFTRLMAGAEHFAEQASCPRCRAYAKFRLLRTARAPALLEGRSMTVCCRVCGTEWTIG
jgi:hypothetical protein